MRAPPCPLSAFGIQPTRLSQRGFSRLRLTTVSRVPPHAKPIAARGHAGLTALYEEVTPSRVNQEPLCLSPSISTPRLAPRCVFA